MISRTLGTALVVASSSMAGAASATPPVPPPFLSIGGDFDLIDQHGERRQPEDFAGRHMLIFFGYANCEAICGVALPRMVEAVDRLGERADEVVPILITIDPERDTPEALREALPDYHPRLVGLTGSEDALAEARDAYQVEVEVVWREPDGSPIYSHGSFLYLMDEEGNLASVLPPILGPERMAEVISGYLDPEA